MPQHDKPRTKFIAGDFPYITIAGFTIIVLVIAGVVYVIREQRDVRSPTDAGDGSAEPNR